MRYFRDWCGMIRIHSCHGLTLNNNRFNILMELGFILLIIFLCIRYLEVRDIVLWFFVPFLFAEEGVWLNINGRVYIDSVVM